MPDDLYQYSNLGYGVLDYIIERVSGKTYPDFMQDEVFTPLGMNHTAVLTPQTYTGQEAVRYNNREPIPFYDFDHRGASAVYAGAHDLIRFGLFHLNQLQQGQKQILSPSTIEKMQNDVNKFGNYAIGWGISDYKGTHIVQHTGGMGGVRTVLTLISEYEAAIVVLTNCENNGIIDINNQIVDDLAKRYSFKNDAQKENAKESKNNNIAVDTEGKWQGTVYTYLKEIPLAITVQDHFYQIQFNDEPPMPIQELYLDGNVLTGEFMGDIQTPDEFNPGNKLELKVVVDGGRMYGAVTSMGEFDGKHRNALSHFVSLTRSQF